MKELYLPASAFEVPATRRGLNGRTWPGHGLPFGPSVMLTKGFDSCGARLAFQGTKVDSVP